ncbi:Isoaspartyl peptidase/L-asparaginase [Orchesella cincta]|uniref:Isoaspartyl peptidase/L-asparaginase n=1 Tax=Orchesella cincta TaxID=48709 RepID=A0A1D2M602_ORCCI|nr:Isoaspartyl peptidase/L-asparaginase [Orchesella cincta]
MDPVVVVHGGAWAIPDSMAERSVLGVQQAASAAWNVLEAGGNSIDAVTAAVTVLEDDPVFDAGTGAVLTMDGTVELDAIIMEGNKLAAGSVACVERIKNPIQLARKVMEQADHVMLVGKGANLFAEECGIPQVPMEQLVTPEAIQSWEYFKKYRCTIQTLFSNRDEELPPEITEFVNGHETVGCVVMDKTGLLSAGTSTGGITAKRVGRVGDSPLIGCGAYADSEAAAVSCTGHGESISKVCLASLVTEKCRLGVHPNKAIRDSIKYMNKRVGGAGGVICIDNKGNSGIGFNTERMAWASKTKSESVCGLNPGERLVF